MNTLDEAVELLKIWFYLKTDSSKWDMEFEENALRLLEAQIKVLSENHTIINDNSNELPF